MSYIPNPDNVIFNAAFPAKSKMKIPRKIKLIVYYVLAVIVFLATFDTYTSSYSGTTKVYIWGMSTKYDGFGILLVTALVIAFPFILERIFKFIPNLFGKIKSSLYLTESAVCGNVKCGLLTKEVKIPLDKIGTLSLVSNWFEKRAGIKRVFITSGSGSIHFAGITNGEEFVNAVFAQIEKRKFCKCETNDNTKTEE